MSRGSLIVTACRVLFAFSTRKPILWSSASQGFWHCRNSVSRSGFSGHRAVAIQFGCRFSGDTRWAVLTSVELWNWALGGLLGLLLLPKNVS